MAFPHERLLRLIYKNGGKITLSSDSHQAATLAGDFENVKALLKEIGFCELYGLRNGTWTKMPIT
ncbi:MAG: hypothetical protein IJX87_05600 [Clostridia bacterium]|nr:hypothetical protein [Clostridia bacterium]